MGGIVNQLIYLILSSVRNMTQELIQLLSINKGEGRDLPPLLLAYLAVNQYFVAMDVSMPDHILRSQYKTCRLPYCGGRAFQ